MKARKTAFVLAGGGSLGAAQVGMLAALVEARVRADVVVGASVGAINGTFFAFHPDAGGIERLHSLWRDVSQRSVFPVRPWSALQGLLGLRGGMISQGGLRRILARGLGRLQLEESEIVCHVVAADATTGQRVVLSEGSALKALLASTAIPGVFAPVEIDGHWLLDGGIASNTPIRAAVEQGAEEIVLLPTGCHSAALPAGPLGITLQALNRLIARQLLEDMKALGSEARFRVVPPVCPSPVHAYDFSRSEDLMRSAHSQTRSWIRSGGLQREDLPAGLLPGDPEACAVFPASAA